MAKNLIKYKDIVKTVLIENSQSRDDDVVLFAKVIMKMGYNLDISNALIFLKKIQSNELPNIETISRCRRKIQEKHIYLRGTLWNKRHNLQKSVIEQLNIF